MADELFEREISRVFNNDEWPAMNDASLVGPDGFLLVATEAIVKGAELVAPATIAGKRFYKTVRRWVRTASPRRTRRSP